ncbi:ferritin [Clostridia bacterium]|nr:ferritin [Clostridia bacterium]
MLNLKVEESINDQINAELFSAYLYLSMSAYLESENLPGFASWMRVQFQEEQAHAMKFFDYVNERGGKVTLEAIEAPQTEWASVVEIFEHTLSHERMVTERINHLMDVALEERDYATESFLRWYIDEQVEEEASAEAILSQLERLEGHGNGMIMLDRELGTRVFTPIAE